MNYKIIVHLLFSISHFTGFSHSQCSLGNFGPTCELKCGQCTGDGSCSQITGYCYSGCNPGYTGSKCEEACPSTCGGDGSCLQYPPYCRFGCEAGYTGLRCDQVTISTCPVNCLEPCGSYECPSGCLPGYYGFNCSFRCSCPPGVSCQQISGVCEITTYKTFPSVLTSSITVSADTTTNGVTETAATFNEIIANTETTEKTTATTEATEKIMSTTGATEKTVATTGATEKTIIATTGATERTVATTEAREKTILRVTSRATSMPAKTTTPATYGTFIVIHYVDKTGVNVANNTGATTLPTMPIESLSFYTAVFWVPIAVLSLVVTIACIRTILRHARKSKNNISSYESRFVLSEEINVAYDRLNEPENIYIELERMSTTASFSNNGGGSQYYSSVASLRDHANFRSDNRAFADPAFSGEGIISNGQPQRGSEAHSYLYLTP